MLRPCSATEQCGSTPTPGARHRRPPMPAPGHADGLRCGNPAAAHRALLLELSGMTPCAPHRMQGEFCAHTHPRGPRPPFAHIVAGRTSLNDVATTTTSSKATTCYPQNKAQRSDSRHSEWHRHRGRFGGACRAEHRQRLWLQTCSALQGVPKRACSVKWGCCTRLCELIAQNSAGMPCMPDATTKPPLATQGGAT